MQNFGNCGYQTVNHHEPVDSMPVAMAYVPWQKFQNTFEPSKALEAGTIFPELYKPFCGKRGGGRS